MGYDKNEAVIYIDRCINKHDILTKIIEVFNLRKYRVEYDEHYRCKIVWIGVLKMSFKFGKVLLEYIEMKKNSYSGGS